VKILFLSVDFLNALVSVLFYRLDLDFVHIGLVQALNLPMPKSTDLLILKLVSCDNTDKNFSLQFNLFVNNSKATRDRRTVSSCQQTIYWKSRFGFRIKSFLTLGGVSVAAKSIYEELERGKIQVNRPLTQGTFKCRQEHCRKM
jgi:hypothetical protein